MRAPTVIELGQAMFGVMIIVGLWMLLPLGWFILAVGVLGFALFLAIEHRNLASAQPTESDGT